MMEYGLLGKKLSHSYSPYIHERIGGYEYGLIEKTEAQLEDFFLNGNFKGLNVTVPYKKTVMKYLDRLSDSVKKIGCVNTIVKEEDGTLSGFNTDYYGFNYLLDIARFNVAGKKVLVLGSGGASLTVRTALNDRNAGDVIVISRSGNDNYENISRHYNADFIINTTPVGMFPDNLNSPIQLKEFSNLAGVADIIYNPAKTGLLLQAEKYRIPGINGISMLVAQAKRSSELFLGRKIEDILIHNTINNLENSMKNIILIGMPGTGKTTIGMEIAKKLGRKFIDTDRLIEEKTKYRICDLINNKGEEYFRTIETDVLTDVCKLSGKVIATGGGCITIPENYNIIHQNALIVWIIRDLDKLSKEGRPLSVDLSEMYKNRRPLYESFCDVKIEIGEDITSNVTNIMEVLGL